MKCRYCGHEIPKEKLHCGYCGKEVRIVPDYNPLEDVLTAQVKGAIDGTESPLDDYEYRSERTVDKKKSSAMSKKQMQQKKKALKRKRRNRLLVIFAAIMVVIVGLWIVLYQFSYNGQVKKGYRALEERDYTTAEEKFEKAIGKKPKKAGAYTGLSQMYLMQSKKSAAEKVFTDAIEENSGSVEIYEACIQFYLETDDNNKIPLLLDSADKKVKKELSEYVVAKPKFSLDDEEIYDDVQQLSLTSSYDIYYTTDGTEPTKKSTKYKEPIQIPEDETVIKAIAMTEDGIPSMIVTKTYVVELPMEDAPAVSPSTGQYEEHMTITIIVPEGYTAYYTTDKSDPTANSTLYTGPVEMPEGTTIFKAVLVNAKGKLSGITTRNYELIINEQ